VVSCEWLCEGLDLGEDDFDGCGWFFSVFCCGFFCGFAFGCVDGWLAGAELFEEALGPAFVFFFGDDFGYWC
jgi:hypothetical protein